MITSEWTSYNLTQVKFIDLPSLVEPSELKNAIRPGTDLPHVLYTAFALDTRNSLDVMTPTKTSVRWLLTGVSSTVRLIISKGAGIEIKK
jgi:hypothetical protein